MNVQQLLQPLDLPIHLDKLTSLGENMGTETF